ncbi:MAG: hypothetical protein JW974_01670 [Alphaproteobacteria bacterium]|nr:hypothetical protein [Alphaproteobacteria bacterium]MBN2675489.1 hypothetical protein [Alphaproteobacteria bacterium]
MIIGFSKKTSKTLSKIFCRNFRHCVVIFQNKKNDNILIQVASDGIRLINIKPSGIEKLISAGWEFIEINKINKTIFKTPTLLTCVGFAKHALGINNPFMWTPDQLYRHLKKLL